MQESDLGISILFAVLICLPILAVIVKYFLDYASALRYVKRKIERANSWNEYVHWKHVLRYLRWSVIPGLTPKRIRRIAKKLRRLSLKFKNTVEKEKSDGLFSMLVPSVCGIFLCCICLASATYAWFTSNIEVMPATLTAANYDISVEIKDKDDNLVVEKNGVYILEKDNTYSVVLTALGSAKTGYCTVKSGENIYYTEPIVVDDGKNIFTFSIAPEVSSEYTFQGVWGTYSSEADIKAGATVSLPGKSIYTDKEELMPVVFPDGEESNQDNLVSDDTAVNESSTDDALHNNAGENNKDGTVESPIKSPEEYTDGQLPEEESYDVEGSKEKPDGSIIDDKGNLPEVSDGSLTEQQEAESPTDAALVFP